MISYDKNDKNVRLHEYTNEINKKKIYQTYIAEVYEVPLLRKSYQQSVGNGLILFHKMARNVHRLLETLL